MAISMLLWKLCNDHLPAVAVRVCGRGHGGSWVWQYLWQSLKENSPTSNIYTVSYDICFKGSGGGRVVKLLACGARCPGFDSRSPHLNSQRLVISCFQVAIWLKYR